MSALTDKLKKRARALIPQFYREYKGKSDWWHSVRVDGKDYDLNFLTHDPDGTGAFRGKFKYAVRVVAYKDGIDGKSTRLGFFNGMNKYGKTFYKNRRKLYNNPSCGVNMNPASFSEFRTYLTEILIPDLRDSEMNSTADDFETASYYLTRGRDKKYPAWRNFIMKTLVPDLKESGQVMTAKDFVTAVKYIDAGRSVVKNPPELFKKGGYAVVVEFKSGDSQIGEAFPTEARANSQMRYLMQQYARLKLTRGLDNVSAIRVLPVTSVAR